MNSAEKLALTFLERLIPPETFKLLQPENVRGFMNAVGNKMNALQQQMDRIEKNQQLILDTLNDRNNGSGKPILGIVDGSGTGTHG